MPQTRHRTLFEGVAGGAMPEESVLAPTLGPEFENAKAQVEAEMNSLGMVSPRPLSLDELRSYEKRNIAVGWRHSVEFGDDEYEIDILLPKLFPWRPIRIAVFPNKFPTWPHVERDGVLCLMRSSDDLNFRDSAGVLRYLLREALKLVLWVKDGKANKDFEEDILSHWGYVDNGNGINVISLVDPKPPSRIVRLCRHSSHYVIADREDFLRKWMAARYQRMPRDFKVETASLVWLDRIPRPRSFPTTGASLCKLLCSATKGSDKVIFDTLSDRKSELVVAFGMRTEHGPAITSAVASNRGKPVLDLLVTPRRGFRKGKASRRAALILSLRAAEVKMEHLKRADPSWIHGRDSDPHSLELRKKKVAIVGCGSVGGTVAVHLAKAGVGNIALIDHDMLEWPNISRHELGASSVGFGKAEALASKIRVDFPHIKVYPFPVSIEAFLSKESDFLKQADLVISAAGSWGADLRIDAWQQGAKASVPVLYGWLEGHASAGHAILIGGPPDSIRFGFDSTGLPSFRVIKDAHLGPTGREPGCGGEFQPYGPVELAMANGIIANLALEVLLEDVTEPCHRVWVAPERVAKAVGDEWSPDFLRDPGLVSRHGFVFERPWPRTDAGMNETVAI